MIIMNGLSDITHTTITANIIYCEILTIFNTLIVLKVILRTRIFITHKSTIRSTFFIVFAYYECYHITIINTLVIMMICNEKYTLKTNILFHFIIYTILNALFLE